MENNYFFHYAFCFHNVENILNFFLFLLSLFFFYVKYIKRSTPQLPPSPSQWPIIGSINALRKHKPIFRWIDRVMKEMNTDIICIRFFRTHVIVVTSDDLAKEFLKTLDTAFLSRPICLSAELVSGGYVSAGLCPKNEQWKRMKRILSSEVLSTARHKWLLNKRNEEADHLISNIFNETGLKGGIVNVRIATQHYCGNVIRKLIFNKRFFGDGGKDGGPGVEEVEHVDAIFKILEYLYFFCVSDFVGFLRGRVDLDGHEKIIRKAVKSVRKYQDPLIDERARQWDEKTRTVCEDLLDVMLSLKSSDGTTTLLSIDEIKAQIVELMIETVDNPSNATEWAIAEMINQPQMLQRAIDELDTFVGRDRLVQESDLPNLNYIKSCAKEAFRLHPVAPFNPPHVSIYDTTVAGYFIPKGSHVLISRRGLGRNPKIWDDPLKFNPDRHYKDNNNEVALTDHDLRLFSFSTGRRGCPGVLLGSTITTMLLARLLQGFTWSPPNESCIDLTEAHDNIFMAKHLLALAKPRLSHNVYPTH